LKPPNFSCRKCRHFTDREGLFSLAWGFSKCREKCRGKGREKAHNQKIGIFRKGRIKKIIKIGKIESSLVSLKNVNDDSGLLEESSGGVEESSGLLVKTQATQSTDGRGWELPRGTS